MNLRTRIRSLLAVSVLAIMALPLLSAGATSTFPVSFNESSGIFGEPNATIALPDLPTVTVPADLVGKTCTVTVTVQNNESHREGSAITATTGTLVVQALNVESTTSPNPVVATGTGVMGSTLNVLLTFGPVAAFSASGSVDVTGCVTPPTTTMPPTITVGPPTSTVVRAPAPVTVQGRFTG